MRRGWARVVGWPVWALPPALRWYVIGVITAAAAATGAAAVWTMWRPHDILLFGLLTGFGAIVVELTRRTAEPAGSIKDIYGAWQIPIALLLPPVYCLAVPAVTFALQQARARHTIAHRRVFSAAAYSLSLGIASVTFHTLPTTRAHSLLWLAAIAGCALLWLVPSQLLVMTAVWASDRTVSIREQSLAAGSLLNDLCEIAAAVVLTGVITGVGLIWLVPALPLVVVLQRSFRHAQLVSAARIDAGTGLLTGATWRAEATVQLARPQRTGSPAAVVIADLDQFRAINDECGREAGEVVLAGVAGILRASLRPGDLIGRFGSEGFAILLPEADANGALQAADRIRGNLAAQPIAAGREPLYVTITGGIAATGDLGTWDLTELLAAADAALYRAKEAGRDRVCLAPGSTGTELEAHSAAGGQAPDGQASEHDEREQIAAARRELGRKLATRREQAAMTQQELADMAGYSRSAVAEAERGKARSAHFWAGADRAVGAGGNLIAHYSRIEAAAIAARRQAAQQALAARTAATDLRIASSVADDSEVAVTGTNCPRCGEALRVTARVVAAVIPEISGNRARQRPE